MKHIPTAPMPGPPHSSWTWAPSARSQTVIGLVVRVANDANSFETHPEKKLRAVYPADSGLPGSPKSDGQHRGEPGVGDPAAEVGHLGVMPGISWMMTIPGPGPAPVDGAGSTRRGVNVVSTKSAQRIAVGHGSGSVLRLRTG